MACTTALTSRLRTLNAMHQQQNGALAGDGLKRTSLTATRTRDLSGALVISRWNHNPILLIRKILHGEIVIRPSIINFTQLVSIDISRLTNMSGQHLGLASL